MLVIGPGSHKTPAVAPYRVMSDFIDSRCEMVDDSLPSVPSSLFGKTANDGFKNAF
jgi:hypothetical protein